MSDGAKNEFRHWALNSGSRLALKATVSLGNLILAGFLVKALGSETYGVFRSASSSISLLALAEGGLSGAAYGLIVRYIAIGDHVRVAEVFSHSSRLLLKVFLIVATLSWPVALLLAIVYKVPAAQHHDFVLTATLACLGVGFGFLSAPSVWVMQAHRQEYILNLLHLPIVIAMPFLTWWFAARSGTAAGTALAVLIATATGVPLCIFIRRRFHPWLRRVSGAASAQEVFHRTRFSALEQVGAVLSGQALFWSASFHLGMKAVAQLALTLTFYAFARELLFLLAHATVPAVSHTYHAGNPTRARKIWLESVILSTALGAAMAGSFWINNPTLIVHWVGAERFAGESVSLLFALGLVTFGINCVSQAALYAVDGVKERAMCVIAESVLAVSLSFLGCKYLGLVGAALGVACAQLATLAVYPALLHRRFGIDCRELAIDLARILTIAAILSWILRQGVEHVSIANLAQSVVATGVCGSVLVGGIFLLGLNGEHRQRCWFRIKQTFNRPPQ